MNGQAILLSVCGSIVIQLLNLAELAKVPKSRRPDFGDVVFWLPFLIYPAASALIAFAYFDDGQTVNKMLAIQLGASSPLIFKTLANVVPEGILHGSE